MLCGYPPFNGDTDKEIMDKVKKGKYHFDYDEWRTVTDDAIDLITKMMEFDINKRLSAE